MKIEILVPVATDFRNTDIKEEAQRFKHSDVDIAVTNINEGPTSIECDYDDVMSGKYAVELAESMEKDGADGIVIYCFNEPALAACKEKLNIPVVGLREAPIAMASLLGDNIGVIAALDNTKKVYSRVLKNKVRYVTSLDLPVLEYADQKKVENKVEAKIRELIDIGCDVIVLGCGSMLGVDIERLKKEYNIPIILPIHAAISVCDYLIRQKLTQSKIAYPYPPEKEIK